MSAPTIIDQAYITARKLFKFGMKHDTVVDRLTSKYVGKLYYSDCRIIAQAVRQELTSPKQSHRPTAVTNKNNNQELAHV